MKVVILRKIISNVYIYLFPLSLLFLFLFLLFDFKGDFKIEVPKVEAVSALALASFNRFAVSILSFEGLFFAGLFGGSGLVLLLFLEGLFGVSASFVVVVLLSFFATFPSLVESSFLVSSAVTM